MFIIINNFYFPVIRQIEYKMYLEKNKQEKNNKILKQQENYNNPHTSYQSHHTDNH